MGARGQTVARPQLLAHNGLMETQIHRVPWRELLCARCGAAFHCGLGGDCWCAAEPVRAPMPAPGSDEDCLCPACLRAAALGSAPNAN